MELKYMGRLDVAEVYGKGGWNSCMYVCVYICLCVFIYAGRLHGTSSEDKVI